MPWWISWLERKACWEDQFLCQVYFCSNVDRVSNAVALERNIDSDGQIKHSCSERKEICSPLELFKQRHNSSQAELKGILSELEGLPLSWLSAQNVKAVLDELGRRWEEEFRYMQSIDHAAEHNIDYAE